MTSGEIEETPLLTAKAWTLDLNKGGSVSFWVSSNHGAPALDVGGQVWDSGYADMTWEEVEKLYACLGEFLKRKRAEA